jgi:hypothetical protein
MNSISGVDMNKSFLRVISVSATLVLVGSLASCSRDSDTNRNRNSALGPVACVDAASGKLNAEYNLEIQTCANATQWAEVGTDGTVSEKKDTTGTITLPIIGKSAVKVRTFDANGNVIGNDTVKMNGSRGGFVYRIDNSGAQPVYFEAAPIGWSGSATDPRTEEAGISSKINEYNDTFSPKGDWFLGDEWEMRTILFDAKLSTALGISGGNYSTYYWTSKRPCSICALLIEKPAIAQYGYVATYAYSNRNNYLRPIRSFTSGTEMAVAVIPDVVAPTTTTTEIPASSGVTIAPEITTAPEVTSTTVATTTTEAPPTTSLAPAPTTVPLNPKEQVVADIVDPVVTVVKVPAEETIVSVTPAIIEEWVSGRTTEEIASVDVSFDGETFAPIAMDKTTDLTIPATATEAILRITTAEGEKVEINKTLQRTGENVEATTTTTSTVVPTPADEIPDEGTLATSDDGSSSNALWIGLGALAALIAAGATFQIRRKKK